MEQSKFLTTQGTKLVDRDGKTVILRGFGLGGWMNMENFITGYPANETAQRQVIYDVLGEEKYELFFERFLECFFTEDDAKFIKSLGKHEIYTIIDLHALPGYQNQAWHSDNPTHKAFFANC